MVDDHQIILRGVVAGQKSKAPTILQRSEQQFIPVLLDELSKERGLETVARTVASTRDEARLLKLFQPVHRTFHIVLFEAVCGTFGEPRLDPTRIDSAGLLVRRVAEDERGRTLHGQYEGWRQAGHAFRGWVKFNNTQETELDPDPKRRRAELRTGHAEIDRRLTLLLARGETLSESFSPLFVAPPEVCKAAGKTILYGVVPVTSSEMSESPAAQTAYDTDDVKGHLSRFLQAGGPRPLPRANQTLDATDSTDADLQEFIIFLRQVAIELNAFGNTPQAAALFHELNAVKLTFKTGKPAPNSHTTRPAGEFLKDAVRVLVERDGAGKSNAPRITMPVEWPKIDKQKGDSLTKVIAAGMGAQLAALRPREGRFDNLNRQFQVRGFVRVKRDDGCPPLTVWSDYSEPFAIARWYDSSGGPPVHVELPGLSHLKKLKPNVSFAVPKEMFDLLQGDPKGLLKGEKGGPSLGIDWICGFSIPIITFCAFFCFNIFLSLFDLFFSWMLFVKICIPIPKKK